MSESSSPTLPGAEPPQWLSDEERATWLSLVRVMVTLPAALDAQLHRDADLSYIEYMVLAMLSEQPCRRLRMSELAAAINSSLSRLSHVAKRLESQGYLRRTPDQADGRSTNAVLTDAGLAAVVASAPGHVAAVRSLVFDALSQQQLRGLREAGDNILAKVEELAKVESGGHGREGYSGAVPAGARPHRAERAAFRP